MSPKLLMQGIEGLFFQGLINGSKVVAVFVKSERSNDIQSILNQSGFQAINIPEGITGNPKKVD